jgi:hypothetical protein
MTGYKNSCILHIISTHGREYKIEPNFGNSIINSYLPTVDTFARCAKEVGFNLEETYSDRHGKIAVVLMKFMGRQHNPERSPDIRAHKFD